MFRFGVLGAANITPRALVYPCIDEPRAQIYAVAARDRQRATAFAHHHHIPEVLDSYAQLVEFAPLDAIYNPLHITAHHDWTLRALAAGKHVLCEKSLASNAEEARAMAEAAEQHQRVLMDAYHYRYHPLFLRAREIYAARLLGDIQHIDAAFHIPVKPDGGIRMDYRLGGGVTMDIGCYPISWVRHISGEEPEVLDAQAEVGPKDVDVYMTCRLRLPSGVTATTSGDMRPGIERRAYLHITGSEGSLLVDNPLVPQNGHDLQLTLRGHTTHEQFARRSTYGYQLDAFLDAVQHGHSLYTDGWDGVKQMQVIDAVYQAAGLPLRGM
ncbi:MAG: Gfo/Idh/MocA family oxidoreductase [Pseudomonadota bacterium]